MCGYIHNFVFTAGVNDTGNKLFTSVDGTSDNLSAVSLLPAINFRRCRRHCWLSLVPDFQRFRDGNKFIPGNIDTGAKFIVSVLDTANEQLQQNQLAFTSKCTLSKNLYMSVNSSPTASKQNFSQLLPESSPMVIKFYFWISPQIFVKIRNGCNGILGY